MPVRRSSGMTCSADSSTSTGLRKTTMTDYSAPTRIGGRGRRPGGAPAWPKAGERSRLNSRHTLAGRKPPSHAPGLWKVFPDDIEAASMLLGDCRRPLASASALEDLGAVLACAGHSQRERRWPGPGIGHKHRVRCQLGRSPGSEPAQKTWSEATLHVGRPSLYGFVPSRRLSGR